MQVNTLTNNSGVPLSIAVWLAHDESNFKYCSRCNDLQDITEFPIKKQTGKPDSWCKRCNRETTLIYKRTPRGLVQSIYTSQKSSSIKRLHPKPDYTFKWLLEWVCSRPNFEILYAYWIACDYTKNSIPSVDRINANLPYTKENIRLTTWAENNALGNAMWCTTLNTKLGVQVDQLDLYGNYLCTHPNTSFAAKTVGCTRGEISRVCRGGRNTCRNFKWRYTNGSNR
jgi:hypothetical protein